MPEIGGYTDSEGVRRTLKWRQGAQPRALQNKLYTPYGTPDNCYNNNVYGRGPIPLNPHRGYVPGPTIPAETTVSRNAPYGSRLQESIFSHSNNAHSTNTAANYDSMADPYLYDYFVKKFSNIQHSYGQNHPGSRPGSASRRPGSGKHGKSTTGKNHVIYKVAVTTGDRKNAGTDAKVYLRMHGSKGKLPKHHLTKKTPSGKKRKIFKFNRGTTHIFKFEEKDIGELLDIDIEHDGLTKKDGWFLEQIEIVKRNPRTGVEKMWLFKCDNWLSLHVGDCQISRTLYAKTHSKTEYEVVVVTGSVKGGGTEANVFITIFGKTGQTAKLQLRNNNKNTFDRGHSDIFILKTACVGQLSKVRIQHDNTGMGPGWFLDRIVVTDLRHPKWKFYFPCGQWLAKDEGDRLICRDLIGSLDPLAVRKMNPYKVTVFTGDKRGAGTDANVYMTLFGTNGDTGERKLSSKKNNFERNQVDEFMVEAPCIGEIKRLRIGHDNYGPSPGWFLDKVIIDDIEQNRVYEFPCQRWFAKDEDDGLLSRDLIAGLGADDPPPGVPYTIQVTTGDRENASTSARVYVVLFGGKDENQSSGKIWLNKGKFHKGRTDIFNVEVADNLSPLSRIEVGHDNSGPGPGWYLDRIMVNCPSAGFEQWFLCDKWLAIDEGDGLIDRTLYESTGMRKKRAKMITWFCKVYTSDVKNAGTDANVQLVVYGKDKEGNCVKSDEIKLDNKGDNFEKGNCDKFKIEMIPIGHPFKIRVGHDNSGSFAGWHLEKVELENMSTKKRYTFSCNRWLARDEDDGSIVREMPAEGEDIKKPERLLKYAVEVHTGSKRGAGTDANVFLNVFGEQGDTGDRALVKSSSNKNKFEKGRVDEFILEAVSLRKLQKIRIGHDGMKAGDGWFLDKVVVRPLDSKWEEVAFECNRWLDVKEDDGLIVREITAGGAQMLSTTSYHVTVKTGDVAQAGTDANVTLKIFGDQGDTGTMPLRSSEHTKNKFEKGRSDIFKLEATDIGKLQKIRIGHDGTQAGSGWFLDEVSINIPSKGENYVFACHRWLDVKEDDGQTEIEIEPSHIEKGSVKIPYEVTVWTGDIKGAGTDSNVFLQMYGDHGKTEEYFLRNRTDNFERAQVDKFKIEAADVGPLLKVRIGHDGKGAFSGWFMEKMLIQRHPIKGSKRRKLVRRPSSRLISRSVVDEDSENENRRSWSNSPRRKKRHDPDQSDSDDRTSSIGRRKRASSARSSRSGSGRGRDFDDDHSPRSKRKLKNRRFDDDSEDSDIPKRNQRQKMRNRKFDDDSEDSDIPKRNQRQKMRNRKFDNDSEDSDIPKRNRKQKMRNRKFDEDSEDSDIPTRNRRQRKDERNERDGRESPADGRRKKKYLRKTEQEGSGDQDVEEYWFVCNKWFARNEDDKKIVRELLPTDENGKPLDTGLTEIDYIVRVHTGDVWGAGTDANVLLKMTGEFGDTGERELKNSDHMNKFERNQVDAFTMKAVELGSLRKLKIRHDNKGGMAAWFLGHVEVEDPKNKRTYFFPCQKWLATDKEDGQIARELVPVDAALRKKLSDKDAKGIRDEIALETKAAMTTYNVYTYTSDKFGAGTDANVYVYLFGEIDDTGQIFLKSSKTNRNKFEKNQMDEFVIEAFDIGDLKKMRIGHDNTGGGGDWHLDRVEIDCPSLGKKWYFPCGRWLAKGKDDGQTEVELFPQDMATEEYGPCVPYEVTTYTSNTSGSGTDADVYIVIYGQEIATSQKSLCPHKRERKRCFEKGQVDKFVVELEDIGSVIEKIRIGHDGKGFGAGWHLDKVEVRRLKASGKGSETYTFPCGRWLSRSDDDGAIERELVPENVLEETIRKDGTVKKKQNVRKDTLVSKKYLVNTITGDVSGAGTDANVYLTIYGDKGDSGERKLHKSETHRDKFERGQTDIFNMEAIDLGNIYKVKIRHDNAMLNPSWFLDRVEVQDTMDNEQYVFHCERWLAKNKEDGKIERSLYVKGYEGTMSSTSTLRSTAMGASMASLDSHKSFDPFSKSPRVARRQLEEIPEGPTIAYTVRIRTGEEKDNGTDSNAWIKIHGPKKKHSGRLLLDLAQKKMFMPGSVETFSLEGADVGDVKQIEIGHDGVTPGSGWFVKEVEVDMPTKGKHYFFTCKAWLARDKSDGKTSRIFTLNDGEASIHTYKALVPYEVTVYTGDESGAGTDAEISMKVFGSDGTTTDYTFEKLSERFERGRSDFIKMELEDIGVPKKLRIGHNGKGRRPEWYLEKVELRNMDRGDLAVFHANCWFSKNRDDGKIVRDLVATIKGKKQLKLTSYKISVKTSDVRGAGTDANVYVTLFGENGDSGEVHLRDSETNNSPFENNQLDVFNVQDSLSLGQLFKARIWHDNKGIGAAWHCQFVEVEDLKTGITYMFPCNRWLSKSDDDKQICRELACANPASPKAGDKIGYEIEIITSDKTDAGMVHNAWVILEGEQRSSKEFILENSPRNKILRRGQTDTATMVSKNLGSLERCILGAVEREDKPINDTGNVNDTRWHCYEVKVTNKGTGDKYIFPCKSWINITPKITKRTAKVLNVKSVEESQMTAIKSLGTVKYEVSITTGDVSRAGTDANVFINIYGTNGDTGMRPLQQKLRNLFEKGQLDKFQLEAVDLGDLSKIRIEHDNKGFGAGWFLEKVEIVNMASNRTWLFPCGQWLDKKKGDGQIFRELYPRD